MKNCIKKLIFLLLIACTAKAQDGKFTFTLSSQSHTSAGVFKKDSTLVRTLWSDVIYPAGTHTQTWDGKDDKGAVLSSPETDYVVKVLSNNIQYKWDGTLGNNSDSMTGESKYRGYYHCMKGLALGSTYGYYCTGYSEGSSSIGKFKVATPQTKTTLLQNATNGQTGDVRFVVTDDINVYWSVCDANANSNSFIFGTKVADDSEVPFLSGTPYAVIYGKTYKYAINQVNMAGVSISGMAVQKKGNYLFVARALANQLHVVNKTTGALVQTLTYTTPGSLSVDASDNLWMVTGTNTISKYTVNSNGTLSATSIVISSTVEPVAIQVSTDGTTLAVADAASNVQQLKFFNTSNGLAGVTLGVAGGYTVDATVTNNKFYFNDTRVSQIRFKTSFIAYQADGSYWVSDPGNFRVQHYSANNVFINRIMSLGSTYRTWVDKNNITRVFSDYLEFSVDYSKPLTGATGWTLVKNWGANVRKNGDPGTGFAYNAVMLTPITLKNGRTYMWLSRYNTTTRELVELVAGGTLRFTGLTRTPLGIPMAQDGSLHTYAKGSVGGQGVFKRFPLTGFDANNNPIWSTTADHVTTTPVLTIEDPEFSPLTTETISSTNKIIFYNPSAYQSFVKNSSPLNITYPGYHLGIMETGGNKWLMKTEQATHLRYTGAYPGPGFFDIGNGVNLFAGGNVNVVKRHIITSYHGEFWKASQTNKYNHYLDNGLAIGQFGTTRPEVGFGVHAAAGMAGNSLTPCVIESVTRDTMFLYHGDESDHSGIHRWSITNLNSIAQQQSTIKFPVSFAPVINYTDLMAGLPFDDTLTNNTAGWTRSAPQNLVNQYSSYYNVKTSVLKFDRTTSPDIQVTFVDITAKSNNVSRDLGTNNVSSDWKISGFIAYPSSMINGTVQTNVNSNQYLEVLDNAGKVLTRFHVTRNAGTNPYTASIMGNADIIATDAEANIRSIMNKMTAFEVGIDNGVVTFRYDGYPAITTTIVDPTANWKSPKTLRIQHVSVTYPNVYSKNIDLKDFRFYKDVQKPVVLNEAPVANAGADQVLTLPTNSTNLIGNGADADGTIKTYLWTKISGSAGDVIVSPNTAGTGINSLVQGAYLYELTVTDDKGAIGKDTVQILVNILTNQAPSSDAGLDQSITLPINSTTLTGIGIDVDGTISSYRWAQVSGPAGALIASPGAASTAIVNLIQGIYDFELSVTDDDGAVKKDTVNIIVNSALNQPPVANAGIDQALTLPANSTMLMGTGTDPNGRVASYAWVQLSGPAGALIVSPDSAFTTVNNLVQGIYDFELTVTDDYGQTSKDIIQVVLNGVPNQAPTADAGIDQFTTLPVNSTTLTGIGADTDGTISSYAWLQVSGPSSALISSPNGASTAISSLVKGSYEFELSVTDDKGAVKKDTINVTVNSAANQAPSANAGVDQSITLPSNSTTLNGVGNDTDGSINKYSWIQLSGPSNSIIISPDSATTVLDSLVQGVYQYQLTITDDSGAIAVDFIQVSVNTAANQAAIADAGADQVIALPTNSTILSGIGTDVDGTVINYGWQQVSGPSAGLIVSPNAAATVVSNLVAGTYVFEMTVTDDSLAISKDTLTIIVDAATNKAPIADAGTDQVIILPTSSTTLMGGGADADGIIFSYAWSQISGPSAALIVTSNGSSSALNNLVAGVYTYELTITDDSGAVAKDTIMVVVNAAANLAPVADAGSDQFLTLPADSASLTGIGRDADGTIATYTWAQLSGPSNNTIVTPDAGVTFLSSLLKGVYEFELTVIDDSGSVSKDTLLVTVSSGSNMAPLANAGTDQLITLPTDSTSLIGDAVDSDGKISHYNWVMISGPAGASITTPDSAITSINGLLQGVYQFELTATDDSGAVSKDIVQITVNAGSGIPPVAHAGADQSITLPVNSIILNGSGIDADGTIISYAWVKISGPSALIDSTNAAVTAISGLTPGVYEYQLTVRDNEGLTAIDTIKVIVNAAANQAPTANAGTDQVITLPINIASLTGVGADADGTISNYIWTKLVGPTAGIITSPGASSTAVDSLVMGVYQFELSVTDDSGAVSRDTVQVTVNAGINYPPLADAGLDRTITLPVDSVSLNGIGIDVSGAVVGYAWKKISGPISGNIASPNTPATQINGLAKGVYEFEFAVTDNEGAISRDTIRVTVNAALNQLPVANAGSDQVITLPVNSTTISGNATDADGTISNYSWTKVSGPLSATIASPNTAITSVANLVQGLYQFELTVTDDSGAVSKDTIQVTVNNASNVAPVADAGTNSDITLPVNTAMLNGSGIDTDGTVVAYSWIQVSGPNTATIASLSSAATSVSNLVQGIYKFELTITDNNGAIAKDMVQVTVNAASNKPPVANAGIDQVIILPNSSTNLIGIGTDVDGTVVSYLWVKIAGPGAGVIISRNAAATSLRNLKQGTYLYQLTVTDSDGAIAYDTVQVEVKTAANVLPTANAGADKAITLPVNSTSLAGTGADSDGTIVSYAWVKISGPASGVIASPASGNTAINNLVQGVYQYELTVVDNNGGSRKDTVAVTVNAAINIAPNADAGVDQTITLPTNNVTLTGSGTDADGTIASYAWIKINGPAAGTIVPGNSGTAAISNLTQGVYQYQLTITDNSGAASKDTVQVTVNQALNMAPTAFAGTNQSITLPTSSTTLTGRGTDADGTIKSYVWIQVSGPAQSAIASPNAASTVVNGLALGTYQYELTVTDNNGSISKSIIQVLVNPAPNKAPVVNGGVDQVITLPTNTALLTGNGTDTDGTIVNFRWEDISGATSAIILSPNAGTTSINNLAQGIYQFEITATDNSGATSKDTVKVTVNAAPNRAPLANAGTDKTITLPTSSTTLSGTGTDTDGTIANYTWVKVSGPAGTITSPNSGTTAIDNLVHGVYKYQLTVVDNSGASSKDTVTITVNPAPNQAPVANAGADKVITLPANNASLTGAAVDADGTISSYAWIKISGPATGTMSAANLSTATVANLVQGVYQYELTVTDNNGAASKDTVKVTVNAAANVAPSANAGADKIMTLPVNSTTLTGTGADTDGTIASYLWTRISGPVAGTITSPASGTTTIDNLLQGVYLYQLTVSDNSGAISKDTVKITVNAAPNKAPTANAGLDKVITLPTNSTTLSGVGTDTDGTITTYAWIKISGPVLGSVGLANAAITAINDLVQGAYLFELTVTDNSGAISKDTVKVTVNPAPNVAPAVSAGADIVVTLPTNTTSLTGVALDVDGTINSYTWTKIAGPASGLVTVANTSNTSVSNLVMGIYQFELAVKDNGGAISRDTVKVTVNAPPNQAPTAYAGADNAITLPTNSTTLVGSGLDADGVISSYAWTKISGPISIIIATPNLATTAINILVQGTYVFQLTVTDDNGVIARDTVKVTVNPALSAPPVANAGADKSLVLPVNNTTLTGTGTVTSGTIASYSWMKVSGPTAGTIASPNSATTNIAGLVKGVYQYQLTVTDNRGVVGKDTVKVTVDVAANKAPVANAGNDADIILPTNTATLTGSGKDTDGTIASYNWSIINGPSGFNIQGSSTDNPSVQNLFQGVYDVVLTVVDNNGASASDTMKITVSAPRLAPNTANTVSVYPNPVVDFANVNIATINANEKVSLTVTNARGMRVQYKELIITGTNTIHRLDMTNLNEAIYFITVRFEDGKQVTTKVLRVGR